MIKLYFFKVVIRIITIMSNTMGRMMNSLNKKLNESKRLAWKGLNGLDLKNKSLYAIKSSYRVLSKTRGYRGLRLGLIFGITSRLAYVYGTSFQKEITVTKSFHRLQEKNNKLVNEYMIRIKIIYCIK